MESKIITGTQLFEQVGKRLYGPKFNLDDLERRKYYEQVFYLLNDNPKMERFALKPGKGFCLLGDIGVGKTMMVKTMQVVFKDTARKFKWVSCLSFKDMLEEGYTGVEIKAMYGKALKMDLYIDDLGLGQTDWRKFGNVTNIVSEIIFERDELFVSEKFLTHFSSNTPTTVAKDAPADAKSLERLYGDRMLDRIKQLDNLIIWTGKSLRGK